MTRQKVWETQGPSIGHGPLKENIANAPTLWPDDECRWVVISKSDVTVEAHPFVHISHEKEWDEKLSDPKYAAKLRALADKAVDEHRKGKSEPLDPNKL